MSYTGTPELIEFKKLLEKSLEKTEFDGISPEIKGRN